jgi:hypothetical protein
MPSECSEILLGASRQKRLGILLVINRLGWMLDSLGPYVLPNANLGFTFVTFFGEIFFMLWLLIRGWKIRPLGHEALNGLPKNQGTAQC